MVLVFPKVAHYQCKFPELSERPQIPDKGCGGGDVSWKGEIKSDNELHTHNMSNGSPTQGVKKTTDATRKPSTSPTQHAEREDSNATKQLPRKFHHASGARLSQSGGLHKGSGWTVKSELQMHAQTR